MDTDTQAQLDALNAVAELVPKLAERPLDIRLHHRHVALSLSSGMEDQVEGARQTMVGCVACTEDVWIPLLAAKVDGATTVEAALEAEALFEQAERDYLSIPILKMHLDFLLSLPERVKELPDTDEELLALFTPDEVSQRAVGVVAKASGHLGKSHEIWDAWMEWEEGRLAEMKKADRAERTPLLHEAYKARLAIPHLNHQHTYESYSSFVSSHLPSSSYEPCLVEATSLRKDAMAIIQARERFEQSLTSLPAWNAYITWESSPKPQKTRGRGKAKAKLPDEPPNPQLVVALYERAISEAARQRAETLEAGEEGGIQIAEAWLGSFWDGLSSFLRENGWNEALEISILERAGRSCPSNASLIAAHIRAIDHFALGEDDVTDAREKVNGIWQAALMSGLLTSSGITTVTMSQAAFEIHHMPEGDPDGETLDQLLEVLQTGIAQCRESGGDESLKLEKFLVHAFVELGDMAEEAAQVWEAASKFYKGKYVVWEAYASFLSTQLKDHERARKVYKDAATPTRNLDYPEALWASWIAFEEVHGTVEQLEHAMKRVRKMGLDLAKKREMAAEQAMVQEPTVEEAPILVEAPTPMVVDEPQAPTSGPQKRKADDEGVAEPMHKRTRPDNDAPLKRDRENSTVFVAGLWTGLKDDELKKLFKDCGEVRDVKIAEVANDVVATVEFMDRESVPAALTKDKKRIQGNEVAVFLAWRSTLYVTNFPENVDDASIRQMFGKYGTIFDVRWPSKKFKASRRFCYVQYVSPDYAQAALELNGRELEAGMPLNVYISNPQRKKERTDAGIEQREIYVAGLARNMTEVELRELFAQCGTIKSARLPLDEKGKAKGFGFVEFEQEMAALAALAFNNREVRKRRIAVTMVDPRAPQRKEQPASGLSAKADLEARSVRLRKLPPGTDEGLLQQAIEKLANGITRVEVLRDVWEAVVEFETIAAAGKLLLLTDGLVFNDVRLEVLEERAKNLKPSKVQVGGHSTSASAPSSSFVPRAASKPKARLGLGTKGASGPGPKSVQFVSAASPSALNGQADGMGVSTSKPSNGASSKSQDAFRAMLGAKK